MEWQEITPFRMNQLMKLASKITDTMVTGVWNLSFDEMELVLDQIRYGINAAKERNQKEEDKYVSENNVIETDHEEQPETLRADCGEL